MILECILNQRCEYGTGGHFDLDMNMKYFGTNVPFQDY